MNIQLLAERINRLESEVEKLRKFKKRVNNVFGTELKEHDYFREFEEFRTKNNISKSKIRELLGTNPCAIIYTKQRMTYDEKQYLIPRLKGEK
jgi:hypothetical protein